MTNGWIEVRSPDLEDFHRDLGDVQHRLPDEVENAGKDVAQEVATEAQGRAYSLGSTAAHVAPSLKADGANVTLGGGDQWAMAPGAEYGRDSFAQFQPYTGSGENAGYFLTPTIRDTTEDQVERFADGIDDALGEAFR